MAKKQLLFLTILALTCKSQHAAQDPHAAQKELLPSSIDALLSADDSLDEMLTENWGRLPTLPDFSFDAQENAHSAAAAGIGRVHASPKKPLALAQLPESVRLPKDVNPTSWGKRRRLTFEAAENKPTAQASTSLARSECKDSTPQSEFNRAMLVSCDPSAVAVLLELHDNQLPCLEASCNGAHHVAFATPRDLRGHIKRNNRQNNLRINLFTCPFCKVQMRETRTEAMLHSYACRKKTAQKKAAAAQ